MVVDHSNDERRQIEHVHQDLLREFASLPADVVDELFASIVHSFDDARVRTFVPVLVRRGAREQLRRM